MPTSMFDPSAVFLFSSDACARSLYVNSSSFQLGECAGVRMYGCCVDEDYGTNGGDRERIK